MRVTRWKALRKRRTLSERHEGLGGHEGLCGFRGDSATGLVTQPFVSPPAQRSFQPSLDEQSIHPISGF